jgi:hypothetical protein
MKIEIDTQILALDAVAKYLIDGSHNCYCEYGGECMPCMELRECAIAAVTRWKNED